MAIEKRRATVDVAISRFQLGIPATPSVEIETQWASGLLLEATSQQLASKGQKGTLRSVLVVGLNGLEGYYEKLLANSWPQKARRVLQEAYQQLASTCCLKDCQLSSITSQQYDSPPKIDVCSTLGNSTLSCVLLLFETGKCAMTYADEKCTVVCFD